MHDWMKLLKKISEIKKITNKSVTEIIKESVDLYYAQFNLDAKKKNKELKKLLSGIAEGPDMEDVKDTLC